MCHSNKLVRIIYMALDFILNFFGLEFDCECGVSHF